MILRSIMTSCPYVHLKVYGLVTAQYRDNDKLLVWIFPRNDRGYETWFTKLGISKIKRWIGLTHLLVEQYKFNSEIAQIVNSFRP